MARYVGIDPSTKTGIVVIDEDGEIWEATEIAEEGSDPGRMCKTIDTLLSYLTEHDRVALEGFSHGSKGKYVGQQYGIGWGIRMALHRKGIQPIEPAPAALKKFTGAGGNASKEIVAVEVYKRWGFQHKSNNVTDAFVLAHIARAMHEPAKLLKYQEEVIKKLRG